MNLKSIVYVVMIPTISSFILPNKIRFSKYKIQAHPSDVIREITQTNTPLGEEWSYKDLITNINNKNIEGVSILERDKLIEGFIGIDKHHVDTITYDNLHLIKSPLVSISDSIVNQLTNNNVEFDVYNLPTNPLNPLLLPLQLIVGYIIIVLIVNVIRGMLFNLPNGNPMGGNPMGGNPLSFLNRESGLISSDLIDTKFNDVAGCDEAKYELEEVVEFLRNPLKFESAGAKIPKGVLLDGPPGTGKTLLAKAVAGEAGVGFISATGSEFIEMFVGVGASRVRKLFEDAEKNKPCVIFIDEIDAIGRQRGAGINSGNDEREQTLNQILTNMDGFKGSDGIIILGATNRADILDNALTRSGRFDRKITVGLPDLNGRKAILDVHLKDKKYDTNIDFEEISQLTGGFSGADIANMANEAAIFSVRYNKTIIDRTCILDAYEKMTIGIPKKNIVSNVDADNLVAFHEIGHTILAKLFNNFFNVRKVTINANSKGAGGYTLFTPIEKYNNYPTKEYFLANIMVALAGRASERILFNNSTDESVNYISAKLFENVPDLKVTTGASNDLKQASNLARNYINNFGINDKLGIQEENTGAQPFIGRDMYSNNKLSEYSKERIDTEVQRIIEYCYHKCIYVLMYNKKNLYEMSELLLKKRTISGEDLDKFVISYKSV